MKNKKLKALQICAGYQNTIIMAENRKLFWFGTCGDLDYESKPKIFNLEAKLGSQFGSMDYGCVRVACAWSRSLSITYLTMADLRSVKNLNTPKINNILNLLASKWDNQDLDPPYIESISGYFSAHFMRKSKIQYS